MVRGDGGAHLFELGNGGRRRRIFDLVFVVARVWWFFGGVRGHGVRGINRWLKAWSRGKGNRPESVVIRMNS